MITATTGLTLNHGWVKGYRFVTDTAPPFPLTPEWDDNRGKVMIYIINGVVEFTNVTWTPLANLLLNGQNNIIDNGSRSVTISDGSTTETIVFDEEDEAFYAILVSNPLIKIMDIDAGDNSMNAHVGSIWDGSQFSG